MIDTYEDENKQPALFILELDEFPFAFLSKRLKISSLKSVISTCFVANRNED